MYSASDAFEFDDSDMHDASAFSLTVAIMATIGNS